jgi:hypothetical protein
MNDSTLLAIIILITMIIIVTILKSEGRRIFDFLWAVWIIFVGFLISLDFVKGEYSLILEVIFWIAAILILCFVLAAIIFLILSFIYGKKKDEKKEHKSIKIFYLSLIIAVLLNIILQILGIFIK